MYKTTQIFAVLASFLIAIAASTNADAQARRPYYERYRDGKFIPPGLYQPYNPTGCKAQGPNLTGDMGIQFDQKRQTFIEVADENAMAYRAGLRAGDRVISANGRRFSSNAELNDFLQDRQGEVIPFVVQREGERKTLLVGLDDHLKHLDRGTPPGLLGISFDSDELAVYVAYVVPNSPAALSGMRNGDEILTLNDERYVRPQDLVEAIAALPEDEPATFRVVRYDRVMRIAVERGQPDEVLVAQSQPQAQRRATTAKPAPAAAANDGVKREVEELRERSARMEKDLAAIKRLLLAREANAPKVGRAADEPAQTTQQ